MKPRTTTHAGKGTAKHNFREFPVNAKGNSDIDRSLSNQNKFYINGTFFELQSDMLKYLSKNALVFDNQAKRFKDDKRYKDLTLSEKYELLYYEKLFGQTINSQHERNASRRQQCLNKNAIDMLTSKRTQPEETILQIGNKDYCPVNGDQLWDIYKDYQKKHNTKYGKYVKILDAALHVEEATLHIHERKVFIGQNQHNQAYPSKESALTMANVERPDKTKVNSRYNNRKQTYSADCRKMWIDVCREHGFDVETVPKEYPDKHGLDLITYKVEQEKNHLKQLQTDIDNLQQLIKDKQDYNAYLDDLYQSDYQEVDQALQVFYYLKEHEADFLQNLINSFYWEAQQVNDLEL